MESESCFKVSVEDAKRFAKHAMMSVGTKESHATAVADGVVLADQRGHRSHGLNKLGKYVIEIKNRSAFAESEPSIEKQTVSTALVNGNNALGFVVGNFAMSLAIQKAKETGVGWVVANNSNHYGMAGIYSLQAVKSGLMGMSFTNTSPFLVPTRSRERFLGTNPLSLGAPSEDPDDPFLLDMATTTVAKSKVEVALRRQQTVPAGWATDAKGQVCTDPAKILDEGGLMPLGGAENTSGYKGFGLAMLVEILCGITAGGNYATKIRAWNSTHGLSNLGQCFIAVNPEMFAPGFQYRMSDLMQMCRDLEPADGAEEILISGDPEKKSMKKVEEDGGLLYHPNVIKFLDELAESCGIAKIERVKL